MALDKSALFAKRVGNTRTVTIEGVGDVVVRSLTRAEALSLQHAGELDVAAMERKLLSLAMIDPFLTEEEVGEWQEVASAGEMEPLATAVQELSGLVIKAVKQEMQSFRG